MREIRSSGSVEGAMGNHGSYSDSEPVRTPSSPSPIYISAEGGLVNR